MTAKQILQILTILGGLVSLAGNVVQYRTARVEATSKAQVEEARQRAEAAAAQERGQREALQRRIDSELASIPRFVDGYRRHLQSIRNALSRLDDFNRSQSSETRARIPEAQNDVKTEVAAFVKFVSDWRTANTDIARLLDGNVTAADAAALQDRFDRIDQELKVLERTFADIQPLLEEAIRSINASPPPR